jgi:hypothetical protein
VAVVSYGSWNCANNTDQNTCKSTITRVNTAGWRTTAFAAPYINSVTSRTSAAFRPLTLLNGWTAGPFSTNNAEIALVGNVVNFRGAIATSGFNQVAFQLPGGFRPAQRVYVPINLCNATKGRLNIAPDGTTTIEPEMGTFSNAQCFTSLDGASFALATADYTALSLQNGWFNAPFGTRNAAVKNINGIIHFAGAMGTAGSNSTAFTLPAGFRPPTTTYVPIDLCNAKKGRLVIEASGLTSIGTEDVFSAAQCFTSLEGASFALNNSGFTTLGLASGWVNAPFGTRNAAVKNDSGIVRFEGAIGSGTSGLIFTLPSAFRPATDVYVPVDLCGATKGRILIQPSGAVTVQSQGAFSNATCFTSLESASFGI